MNCCTRRAADWRQKCTACDVRSGQLFPRVLRFVVLAISTCAALACGSTSVSQVTGPTDTRCQTSLGANPQSMGPDGGTSTVSVSTTRECSWTSTSEASWILLSIASGQGEATFTAAIDANPQITDPDHILVGFTIIIPPAAVVTVPPTAAP